MSGKRPACTFGAAAALAVAALLTGACSENSGRKATVPGGGSAERGREKIERFQCGACHVIQGIRGASGTVGPPLNGIAGRTSLAGSLPNTPANLLRWIKDPQSVEPGSVMPDMGIGDRDARDISAYLYTLR